MENLKPVKAVRDDDGHWYVIPNELFNEFNRLLDTHEDDFESQREFMEKFDKYRTGGDLNLVQLYAEVD